MICFIWIWQRTFSVICVSWHFSCLIMCSHDKEMSINTTWHFSSHRSSQDLEHSWSQSFFVLVQRSRQRTALCKDVEWHILEQECPQRSLDEQLLAQPPSGASRTKSFDTETSMAISLCRRQQSARLESIFFDRFKMKSTSAHMRTCLEVLKSPIMYISCRARLSNTLIRLEVFKNSHFLSSLLRTKEMTTTLISSPWKWSTIAILKALSSVVFWT